MKLISECVYICIECPCACWMSIMMGLVDGDTSNHYLTMRMYSKNAYYSIFCCWLSYPLVFQMKLIQHLSQWRCNVVLLWAKKKMYKSMFIFAYVHYVSDMCVNRILTYVSNSFFFLAFCLFWKHRILCDSNDGKIRHEPCVICVSYMNRRCANEKYNIEMNLYSIYKCALIIYQFHATIFFS